MSIAWVQSQKHAEKEITHRINQTCLCTFDRVEPDQTWTKMHRLSNFLCRIDQPQIGSCIIDSALGIYIKGCYELPIMFNCDIQLAQVLWECDICLCLTLFGSPSKNAWMHASQKLPIINLSQLRLHPSCSNLNFQVECRSKTLSAIRHNPLCKCQVRSPLCKNNSAVGRFDRGSCIDVAFVSVSDLVPP